MVRTSKLADGVEEAEDCHSIWRSQIALRILADMVFWVDLFPGHWKGPDQPLVIGLKLPLLVLDGGGFLYGYSILT